MSEAAWIDSWRHSVPSRLERQDPFENDGFEGRCSTRLTFREPHSRPSIAYRGFSWAAAPFRRSTADESATEIDRPGTRYEGLAEDSPQTCDTRASTHPEKKRKRGLLGLFSRKRKRGSSPSPTPGLASGVSYFFPVFLIHGLGKLIWDLGLKSCKVWVFSRHGCHSSDLDSSGTGDLSTVSRLSYMSWDAVLLCFDVTEKMGMFRVLHWWDEAVKEGFCRDASPAVYLVGTKRDLRMECSFEDHRLAAEGVGIGLGASCCVSPREADWHARRIGAAGYMECSAVTGEGVETLFGVVGTEAAGRAMKSGHGCEAMVATI
ncbi:Small GTPase superfamily [Metarhizium rileyi]|uniref:Small GTPase superfamily n=1 Tax=Metarhizium rileyi (strain RCEF 4871) TaxID=1649241 RepID=A0A166Z7B1_METRR|nr:Small GTPase superfamily [Metarhizium rileyi RCEF 4871]